jgi:hypothetical protein
VNLFPVFKEKKEMRESIQMYRRGTNQNKKIFRINNHKIFNYKIMSRIKRKFINDIHA